MLQLTADVCIFRVYFSPRDKLDDLEGNCSEKIHNTCTGILSSMGQLSCQEEAMHLPALRASFHSRNLQSMMDDPLVRQTPDSLHKCRIPGKPSGLEFDSNAKLK